MSKAINAWTGKVSIGVLHPFHTEIAKMAPRVSQEHVYPRRVAARQLLDDFSPANETMRCLHQKKYGLVHLITSKERKTVQPDRAGTKPRGRELSKPCQLVLARQAQAAARSLCDRCTATLR